MRINIYKISRTIIFILVGCNLYAQSNTTQTVSTSNNNTSQNIPTITIHAKESSLPSVLSILADESGYNIDLQNVNNSDNVTTAPKYSVETSATSRYKGQKCLDCTSTQHKLLAIQNTTENNKVIDFNKGCDIFIHLRTPSSLSGEQVIFSRSSSSRGVEVGLKKNGSTIYAFARAKGSSSTSGYNSDVALPTNGDGTIRVYKKTNLGADDELVVKTNSAITSTDGGSSVTFSGDLDDIDGTSGHSNLVNIRVGCDRSRNNEFTGKIFAIKVYDRSLSQGDANKSFRGLLPSTTMKFGGLVKNIKDIGTWIDLTCVGWSGELLRNTEVSALLLSDVNSGSRQGSYS